MNMGNPAFVRDRREARRTGGRRSWVVVALVAMIAPMVLAIGAPRAAVAQSDGEYLLQCGCPLWWSAPWEGEGTFDEADSLDEVILENGDLTLLIHEIPIDNGTLESMIEDRTEALEDDRDIAELEVTGEEASSTEAMVGRTWENEDGDAISSVQLVLVWETNFLLSIEYIAPEDEFADGWESTELVLLVGLPVFQATSFDDMEALIEVAAEDDPKTSDIDPDLVEAGVIDEGSYESPEFGYEVTWTDEWTATEENTFTDAETSYDQLQLLSDEGWVVTFIGEDLDGLTIEESVDILIEAEEESDSEIVLDDADDEAGGYLAILEGGDVAIYVTVTLYDDDKMIVSALVASVVDFDDALEGAQDAFSVNGDPVLDYFRARDIEEALG
jgi:hypothetical protein